MMPTASTTSLLCAALEGRTSVHSLEHLGRHPRALRVVVVPHAGDLHGWRVEGMQIRCGSCMRSLYAERRVERVR